MIWLHFLNCFLLCFLNPPASVDRCLSPCVTFKLGLYKPVSGAIYFNDELSTDIRYNHLRRQIGFVTQDTQLFAGTIKDNLLFVTPDATDEEITEALKKAATDQMISRSSHGINTILGENGMKLSGGENSAYP